MEASAFPLEWPEGWPRTERYKRQRAQYKVQFGQACKELVRELNRMYAQHVVLSSNVPLRQDGMPYITAAKRGISDPGVAVYFYWKKKRYVVACDQWDHVKDNFRAVGLTRNAFDNANRGLLLIGLVKKHTQSNKVSFSLTANGRKVAKALRSFKTEPEEDFRRVFGYIQRCCLLALHKSEAVDDREKALSAEIMAEGIEGNYPAEVHHSMERLVEERILDSTSDFSYYLKTKGYKLVEALKDPLFNRLKYNKRHERGISELQKELLQYLHGCNEGTRKFNMIVTHFSKLRPTRREHTYRDSLERLLSRGLVDFSGDGIKPNTLITITPKGSKARGSSTARSDVVANNEVKDSDFTDINSEIDEKSTAAETAPAPAPDPVEEVAEQPAEDPESVSVDNGYALHLPDLLKRHLGYYCDEMEMTANDVIASLVEKHISPRVKKMWGF